MSITREDLDAYAIDSHGFLMGVVEFDVETRDGTNRIVGIAAARVLRGMGLSVSSPLNPTDDDLAGIPEDRLGEFLDARLPLAILEMVRDNWGAYNEQNNTTRQDKGSLLATLLTLIGSKRTLIESTYGTSMTVSAPASGVRCDVEPCPCPGEIRYPRWTNSRWV
jgi:hypothetical protein